MDAFGLNNYLYTNNNEVLLEIINRLENIIKDVDNNIIIKRIKDVIILTNKLISDNKKYFGLIRQDIQKLNTNINDKFEELQNKMNNCNIKNNKKKHKKRAGSM